jgi:hypothetical protein
MLPKTQGCDFNYFRKVTVNQVAFPMDSQITINIFGQFSFSIMNEGLHVVEYSFNGNTLHGDLTPGTPTQGLFFDHRSISGIWLRTPAGGPCVVRVEAWGV